jgi:hypothetical protein
MPGKALSQRIDELSASSAMAEIINLNKHRKAKTRDTRESEAAANRIKYGRTKAERQNDRRAEERRDRTHQDQKLGSEPKD